MSECERCLYYEQDELTGETVCTLALDEDEYERFSRTEHKACPYFRDGDEYSLVRHQN